MATSNVCNESSSIPGADTCIELYNTANLNNYIYTQNSGTGPAYSNMCVRGTNVEESGNLGSPFLFMGDGKYHNYTIDWHSGSSTMPGNVNFYIDGVYLGKKRSLLSSSSLSLTRPPQAQTMCLCQPGVAAYIFPIGDRRTKTLCGMGRMLLQAVFARL